MQTPLTRNCSTSFATTPRTPLGKRYFYCLTLGIVLTCSVQAAYRAYIKSVQKAFQVECAAKEDQIASSTSDQLRQVYEGLRTIARLPGVRAIDRYARHFDANAHQSVQEIYNNLANRVAVSEVYIVPVDLDPDRYDPHTHKLQEPIKMYDQLIVGKNADDEAVKHEGVSTKNVKEQAPEVSEIEIFEYRLLKRQLAWLRSHFPHEKGIHGLYYPAVTGPEVITCDNSRYSPRHPDDKDRSGIVYSVPFYGPDGKLKGCISSIILTHVLRDMLPTGSYALLNRSVNLVATSHKAGQWEASLQWINQGRPDPGLVFSRVVNLDVMDLQGEWKLWAGQPPALLENRPEMKAARIMAFLAYALVATITLALMVVIYFVQRHQRQIETQNHMLESVVAERTVLLQRSEAQQRAILEAAVDAIITTDEEGRIEAFNPAAETLLGYTLDEVIGQNIAILMPSPHREAHGAYMADYRKTGIPHILGSRREVTVARKDKSEFPAELTVTEVRFAGGRRFTGFVRDISERKQAEEQIAQQVTLLGEQQVELENQREELIASNEKLAATNVRLADAVDHLEGLATTDGLTGLKNHRAFQERLVEECERARRYGLPLSLILLDVDKFKQFNDTFGHPAGDEALRQVAAALRSLPRGSDIVARYGGEEFTVILIETDKQGALAAAERIRKTIEAADWLHRPMTASLGVATLLENGETPAELIQAADEALYRSKQSGRNRVTHFSDLGLPGENIIPRLLNTPLTDLMNEMVSIQADVLSDASQQIREILIQAYDTTVKSWSRLMDLKDKETQGHSERVTEMTVRLAERMGLTSEEILYARWGALMHDVGKIGIPDSILLKSEPLTEEEWNVIRTHTTMAYELLSPVTFLRPALEIPYCHHEKWDGTGYPQGLQGDAIPMAARLFAIADVYDALTNERPDRVAWSQEAAIAYIRSQQGTHFDPDAVAIFLEAMEEDEPRPLAA